jgi:D-alanyl-D-alanine carboxypeptidase/D-alanyl-D-alanine-endopeptidase (penicillin-binding protein 4)
VTPVVLGGVAVVAAVAALVLNQDSTAEALGSSPATTPVLSARRAPEVLAAPVASARLQEDLANWAGQLPKDTCLTVQSGSDTLFSRNAALPLVGASTQKLVTATAALVALGPDAHLDTVASTAAAPANGVVKGDLYVVGGGDPLLFTSAYAQQLWADRLPSRRDDPGKLADAIKAAGVTRIEGSVVGDGSRYDSQRFNPGWPARYQSQNVVGQLGALMIDHGFQDFPPKFNGTSARTVAPDAAQHAAGVITSLLRERGVTVVGPPKGGRAPQGAKLTTVATLPSASIQEVVGEMLVDSDDDTAEMLLKELGHRSNGVGTFEAGAAAATKILSDAGIDTSDMKIVDGSGLSTDDRVSCQLLMGLMTRPGTGSTLIDHTAVAGKSGTLLAPFKGSTAAGRVHAKTGTLNTVTALAGRAEPAQGGSLMFAFITNRPEQISASQATAWRRSLGEILVAYPRGVDIKLLLPGAAGPETG